MTTGEREAVGLVYHLHKEGCSIWLTGIGIAIEPDILTESDRALLHTHRGAVGDFIRAFNRAHLTPDTKGEG